VLNPIKFVKQWLSQKLQNYRAKLMREYTVKTVTAALSLAHAQEIAHTPGDMLPMVKMRQANEILAVRDGKLDIVDRRSWQWPYLPSSISRIKQPIIKLCVSDDTEFLTKRGWIRADEITKKDVFASRTHKEEFVWTQAKKLMKYRYKGTMLNFQGKGVDQMVTPDHRMLGRYMSTVLVDCGSYSRRVVVPGPTQFLPAKEVAEFPRNGNSYRFQIPLSASKWKGTIPKDKKKLKFVVEDEGSCGRKPKTYHVDLKDWIAFLGIWLAEGSVSGSKAGIDKTQKGHLTSQALSEKCFEDRSNWKPKDFEGYNVGISQIESSKSYKKISALLARLPFNFRRKDNDMWTTCSKALWQELMPLGNSYTKSIPSWVKELPGEYLQLLFDWMMLGDGHVYPAERISIHPNVSSNNDHARMYGTVSKQLADDVQEILQKIGLGSSITVREPKQVNLPNQKNKKGRLTSPFYHVAVLSIGWTGIGDPEKVKYDGYVYCPALPPHETILIRRNGKVSWSGNTPYNARRFSNTPIPRRAINLIKNAVLSLPWDIIPIDEDVDNIDDDTRVRIKAAKTSFQHPNNSDSFQTLLEIGLDDFCTLGAMVIEPQVTPDPKRPIKMWNVDSSTIRIFPNWTESDPDEARYAQMTGLKGERGAILFTDSELMYIRDNPKVDTPFGTGKMEVGFQSVQALLGVHEMSGRAGSDQVHKTFLWWEQGQAPQNMDIVRDYLTNDIEGQSKISLVAGMKPPEVIDVQAVSIEDLLLTWQEMLIRLIANAFDLSPMSLGLEKDINRSTGEVLDDKDFRSAVVPVATKVQEAFTRHILHRKLKWTDLRFQFLGLDDPDLQTKMAMQSQLFAMNCATPNGILKNLGLPKLDSPMADLLQIEMIIINSEVTSKLADQNQANQQQRQSDAQDKQMEQYREMSQGSEQDQQR